MGSPYSAGQSIKAVIGMAPASASAGSANGAAIDRSGFSSLTLHASTGTPSGAPSAVAVDAKVQESADGSTGWTDIAGAAVSTITGALADAQVDVSLETAKKFVRVVRTVGFTGGTSPAIPVSLAVILGGPAVSPQ